MEEPKIVALGGGTGLSTMLRGLKQYTSKITAIVTVADNGGGSGVLRKEMNMLPPGDIRNCIIALSNTEPMMEKLMEYRFRTETLKGQSFGNLFLAAMNDICGNFEHAVRYTSKVLAVTGKVLPVTYEDVQLVATLKTGEKVVGEVEIVTTCKEEGKVIDTISITPPNPKAHCEAVEAIDEADLIVLGPGSLYTSIIPNLLVEDIVEAIDQAEAPVVYVANIMTQPGETDGYNLTKHIESIEKYARKDIIDYIVLNNDIIPEDLIHIYDEDGAEPVTYNCKDSINWKLEIIEAPVMMIHKDQNLIRHDPKKLAKIIINLSCR